MIATKEVGDVTAAAYTYFHMMTAMRCQVGALRPQANGASIIYAYPPHPASANVHRADGLDPSISRQVKKKLRFASSSPMSDSFHL